MVSDLISNDSLTAHLQGTFMYCDLWPNVFDVTFEYKWNEKIIPVGLIWGNMVFPILDRQNDQIQSMHIKRFIYY